MQVLIKDTFLRKSKNSEEPIEKTRNNLIGFHKIFNCYRGIQQLSSNKATDVQRLLKGILV